MGLSQLAMRVGSGGWLPKLGAAMRGQHAGHPDGFAYRVAATVLALIAATFFSGCATGAAPTATAPAPVPAASQVAPVVDAAPYVYGSGSPMACESPDVPVCTRERQVDCIRPEDVRPDAAPPHRGGCSPL